MILSYTFITFRKFYYPILLFGTILVFRSLEYCLYYGSPEEDARQKKERSLDFSFWNYNCGYQIVLTFMKTWLSWQRKHRGSFLTLLVHYLHFFTYRMFSRILPAISYLFHRQLTKRVTFLRSKIQSQTIFIFPNCNFDFNNLKCGWFAYFKMKINLFIKHISHS